MSRGTNPEGKITARIGDDLNFLKKQQKEHNVSVGVIAGVLIKRGIEELKSGAWALQFTPIVESTNSQPVEPNGLTE